MKSFTDKERDAIYGFISQTVAYRVTDTEVNQLVNELISRINEAEGENGNLLFEFPSPLDNQHISVFPDAKRPGKISCIVSNIPKNSGRFIDGDRSNPQ